MKRVVIHWSRHVVCSSNKPMMKRVKVETSSLDLGQTCLSSLGRFPVLSNPETDYHPKHECFVTFECVRV